MPEIFFTQNNRNMQFTAEQIAALAGGRVEGDVRTVVTSFGKIEEALPGQLAFLSNPKYEPHLYTTGASVIIVNESLVLKSPVSATLIRVKDAYAAFATLLGHYEAIQKSRLTGIEQPTYVHESAVMGADMYVGVFTSVGAGSKIGRGTKLYPQVFIGDEVQIGEDCVLHPGVKIYHRCVIGNRVIVHAGTVIGSDGFGFAPQADGTFRKIPQMGNVLVEDDVEIGANCTIDRATIGSTLIRSGAKLDNLLQIAHNVEVGNHTVIAAQSGISGSTKLGRNVMIGGQAGIVGHITIADGSRINAQSGVSKSITKPNTAVTGSPAYDFTSALRSQAVARKLPDMEKRLAELERLVQQLRGESGK
jgi:UDP-3-O-[3-hydroxymyristoyl] glucosamine N-acyltransferase